MTSYLISSRLVGINFYLISRPSGANYTSVASKFLINFIRAANYEL